MVKLIYILITFGYVVIFMILGLGCLTVHIPKEKGMEFYSKARKSLGWAQIILSVFCIIRLLTPYQHEDFVSFWILTTVTLIFSFLTYMSLIYLIETPRQLTRIFLIDGLSPTIIMILAGVVGLIFPQTQGAARVIFGVVFSAKCARMFYVCEKEYRICKKDVDNYYGQRPDIKWIHAAIIASFILSAITVVAFYITAIHLVYYILVPIIYGYLTFKVMNFMPKTLDRVRSADVAPEKKDEKEDRSKDIVDKIAPKVEEWVMNKRFCTPEMTIKDVAMQMGTNHNYLSAYINKHLNMTFQVWLNTLRVEESKKILTSGEDLSIEEVGTKVGFTQNYNFSRWFRLITDMTPYQYRRQNNATQRS